MKRLFDMKLYREGLRYLKSFGIISTVIFTVFSIFTAVGEIYDGYGTEIVRQYVSAWTLNPILILLFCVIAPLMTIILFNFTTNRAASDFYFSVPQTRVTIYFSFFLAVLSWIGIILAFAIGVPLVISLLFSKILAYNFLSSGIFLAQLVVSCLYVIAACLVAISVTGTMFSNIAVALLLIFVPRLFILVIVNSGMGGLYYASATETLPLLSYGINLPVGLIFSTFIEGTCDFKEGIAPIIYTLVLGIAYLIIGMVLFCKRDSGAAGKAATTDKLRAIFRIILGAAIGIGASSVFFSTWGSRTNSNIALDDFSTWFAIVALLTISFAVYCCYDLVMTKSLRKMVKAMPAFLIVLAIDIGAVFGMYGVQYTVESYSPEPEDIKGVYLEYNSYDKGYFNKVSSDIKISDPVINKIISLSLKDNIDTVLQAGKTGQQYHDKYSEYDEWRVYIDSGNGKHYRNLNVSPSDSQKIIERLSENDEYKKAFTQLPDLKKNKTSVYVSSEFDLTQAQREEIYTTFCKEIKSGAVPFERYYQDIKMGTNNVVFYMNCDIFYGLNGYTIEFPVTKEYKQTANRFLSFIDEQNQKEAGKIIETLKSGYDEYVGIDLALVFDEYSEYTYNEENNKKLAEILSGAKTGGITIDDKFVILTHYRYNEKDYVYNPDEDEVYHAIFALNEKQIKSLKKLTEVVEIGYTYYN